MDETIDLQASLDRLNAEALARFDPGSADGMRKLADDLARRRALRKERQPSLTLIARQEAAVRRFLMGNRAPDFRTLRYACLGATHYIAEDHRVLIGDQQALGALLGAVEPFRAQPRRFRRLYDWLLRAYLGADRQAEWFAGAAAAHGNERLRAFLEATFDSVRNSEPAPEWVATLASYPEILSNGPGRRFANGLLRGNPGDLDEACRSLRLTGTSWLAMEALRSATAAAVAGDDSTFVAHIETLLQVAGEPRFATLRDEVYVALVTRYAEVPGRRVHAPLRDALVAAWRNPWLKQNDSPWRQVAEDVRKMVAGWLKLDLIQQFFETLSDDKGQDPSRFEFWSRFHERMDDVYIALGNSAYNSRDQDLVKLRRALEGRLLKLNNAAPDTNAFIMFMGNAVIVEFSQRANAAFWYELRHAPVGPYDRAVTISQLKRADTAIRMIHGRAGGLSWQERFAHDLQLASRTQPMPAHRSLLRRRGTPERPILTAPKPLADIIAFAREHDLNWVDQRSKGGNLWVLAQNDDSEVTRQLKVWGFAYKQGKGWWRE